MRCEPKRALMLVGSKQRYEATQLRSATTSSPHSGREDMAVRAAPNWCACCEHCNRSNPSKQSWIRKICRPFASLKNSASPARTRDRAKTYRADAISIMRCLAYSKGTTRHQEGQKVLSLVSASA